MDCSNGSCALRLSQAPVSHSLFPQAAFLCHAGFLPWGQEWQTRYLPALNSAYSKSVSCLLPNRHIQVCWDFACASWRSVQSLHSASSACFRTVGFADIFCWWLLPRPIWQSRVPPVCGNSSVWKNKCRFPFRSTKAKRGQFLGCPRIAQYEMGCWTLLIGLAVFPAILLLQKVQSEVPAIRPG